jgi:hypothetical protein
MSSLVAGLDTSYFYFFHVLQEPIEVVVMDLHLLAEHQRYELPSFELLH